MNPVSGISNRFPASAAARRAGADAPAPGRALVALSPVTRTEPTAFNSRRPRADFLAHLIATAQQAPQTRERRRAEPAEAIAAYAKANAGVTAGRMVAAI